MKNLAFLLLIIMIFSCKENNKNNIKDNLAKRKNNIVKSENKQITDTIKYVEGLNEVMKEDDIFFNGKLKRYFTLNEFERVFGKPDSIRQLAKEEPCTFILDTELNDDGSNMDQFLYYYHQGSRFENYNEKMAVDEFRFTNKNFVLYKGLKLNSSTTVNDLQKLFPNAVKNLGTMDVYGEGNLQVIQLREDENNVSDGHINIFIKNKKLYYMHWWFPC